MPIRRAASVWFFFLLCIPGLFAKEPPPQVIIWPESGTPVLRFNFGKFKKIGSLAGQSTFVTDTTAENLGSKRISNASFALYLFDEKKVRIWQTMVTITNLAPGETVKFQTTIGASGSPTSVALSPDFLPPELGPAAPPKTISITVNSIPQGALLKLNGNELGTTPKVIQVGVGKHRLEFSKEGFNPGVFPLEVGPADASGGSVSYELGSSMHDTVELRDGSVINGDVQSVSPRDVVVRVGGNDTKYDRNLVKRILLVERETTQESTAPAKP
jgi:hypothetical protein